VPYLPIFALMKNSFEEVEDFPPLCSQNSGFNTKTNKMSKISFLSVD